MIIKIHRTHEGKKILAICDKELLGKSFSDGKKQLDLTTSFYKGEEKTETETKEEIKSAYIVNIVGKHSVEFALRENIISKEQIMYVKKIPHAQALLL